MALEAALLLLSLFLPGYLLVNLIFPSRGSLGSLDGLYRVFLGIVLSISITMAYGSLLVIAGQVQGQVLFLPWTLWPGLALFSIAFFIGGLYRGAYPRLRRRLGLKAAEPVEAPEPRTDILDRLMEVTERLEEARRKGASEEELKELQAQKRRLEEEAGELW